MQTLAFQRSDGKDVLALWRRASIWNPNTRAPLTVDSEPAKVAVPRANAAHVIAPLSSGAEIRSRSPPTVPVNGDPILLVRS